jgi:YVTN family beta-propeller protein
MTNFVIATVPVGTNSYGVAVNKDGTKVYVTNNGDSTVDVIDTATNTVEPIPISVESQPKAFGKFIGNLIEQPNHAVPFTCIKQNKLLEVVSFVLFAFGLVFLVVPKVQSAVDI